LVEVEVLECTLLGQVVLVLPLALGRIDFVGYSW
jgi:hypothetical protein